jgi:hypothetical protein
VEKRYCGRKKVFSYELGKKSIFFIHGVGQFPAPARSLRLLALFLPKAGEILPCFGRGRNVSLKKRLSFPREFFRRLDQRFCFSRKPFFQIFQKASIIIAHSLIHGPIALLVFNLQKFY